MLGDDPTLASSLMSDQKLFAATLAADWSHRLELLALSCPFLTATEFLILNTSITSHGMRFSASRVVGGHNMDVKIVQTLITLVPACALLAGALVLFFKGKTVCTFLQVVGAGWLVVIVLTHICEALHLFPSMGWGQKNSVGHYLNVCAAVLALALFPAGYLIHAITNRRSKGWSDSMEAEMCIAFCSGICHALRMSTKHTKAEKSQRNADELEKRLDDRPDENEKKPVEREESNRVDIDSFKHWSTSGADWSR
jgi:hypothetical protein